MHSMTRRGFLRLSGMTAAFAAGGGWMARLQAQPALAQSSPDPIRHVLDRTTWGPMASDVERIGELGIEGFIDYQLDYAAIPDPLVDQWLDSHGWLQNGNAREIFAQSYEDDYFWTLVPWQRIYRAAYSERQLYELMVEFWTDHFNVPASDLIGEKMVDDREVVRRHALGRFRDLLFASAQSPAMLIYLTNTESTAEHPNENYGREVMELHTLGVDGGYTEDDVKAVSRAFTGWTVREGQLTDFFYDHSMHDTEEKVVLGHVLPAGRGIEDGLAVLDILARHPSTARFIARKLVRRFVSDAAPESLVESAALAFFTSDGDIRTVMRHILTSAEFMAAQGQKFRRPIDFMVAMIRALRPGLTFGDRHWLVWSLEDMGQLPYNWNPPNGYPDAAGAWLNTNGLLNRWNMGLSFPFASEGWYEDIALNLNTLVPPVANADQLVSASAAAILGSPARLSGEDRALLLAYVTDGGSPTLPLTDDIRANKLPSLIGLLLASPQFQWH
jgi:hypothetical protein